MADLREVVGYFLSHYPNPDQLSESRLVKMIYLADWRSAMQRGQQVTDIDWELSHLGPDADEVGRQICDEFGLDASDFKTSQENGHDLFSRCVAEVKMRFEPEHANWFRGLRVFSRQMAEFETSSLTPADKEVLDFVISKTAPISWQDFNRLVNSTYPVFAQPRFQRLDLVKLAKLYERDQSLFELA